MHLCQQEALGEQQEPPCIYAGEVSEPRTCMTVNYREAKDFAASQEA